MVGLLTHGVDTDGGDDGISGDYNDADKWKWGKRKKKCLDENKRTAHNVDDHCIFNPFGELPSQYWSVIWRNTMVHRCTEHGDAVDDDVDG